MQLPSLHGVPGSLQELCTCHTNLEEAGQSVLSMQMHVRGADRQPALCLKFFES